MQKIFIWQVVLFICLYMSFTCKITGQWKKELSNVNSEIPNFPILWYKLQPHSNSTCFFLLFLTCIIVLGLFHLCLAQSTLQNAFAKTAMGLGPARACDWHLSSAPAAANHPQRPGQSASPGLADAGCRDGSAMLSPHTCSSSTPESESRCLQQNSNTAGATSWASKCSNLSSAVFLPFPSINSNNRKTSLSGLYNIHFGGFQFQWYITLFGKPQVVISSTSIYVCEWNSSKQCLLKYPCTRERMDKIDSIR